MIEFRKMEVEVIAVVAERVRPEVGGGETTAMAARDEISDDSTATHT